MKHIFLLTIAILMSGIYACAQDVQDGSLYYLPKTRVKITMLIEKTSFTPGEYAKYSERYLKTRAKTESSVEYKIVNMNISSDAVPDTAKHFFVPMDKKHSILSIARDDNGVLTAINTQPLPQKAVTHFVPARQALPLNPKNFMTEDMLVAGSSAKTAELIGKEIYNIRDSRNLLVRGEAEFMPKDNEQLNTMLHNLSRQEQALMQMFNGVTRIDTTEVSLSFIPEKEVSGMLFFRFSKKLGMVDTDDLAGEPYTISVKDLRIIPKLPAMPVVDEKKQKEDNGIHVNQPGKIVISITGPNATSQSFELYAAQYGRVETISDNLFGKKFMTRLSLNPITGNVESIVTEPIN